ncbi:MAG TPA: anti-sigma factor [Actinomycetota bacterium]
MNCTVARDLMPELALGSLTTRDAALIDRHLAWCAACRKEADDLHRAAALLPYSLAPASPPEELEARVAGVIREAAGGRRSPWARRGRLSAAALVAAMIAISGLGWGAVMAGRADRLEERAREASRRVQEATDRFAQLLSNSRSTDPRDTVYSAVLAGPEGTLSNGVAVELNSFAGADFVIVSIVGLPAVDRPPFPYTVTLEKGTGGKALVGKIPGLNTAGSADVAQRFKRDLSDYARVVVRDATGAEIMSGTLALHNTVPSPAP